MVYYYVLAHNNENLSNIILKIFFPLFGLLRSSNIFPLCTGSLSHVQLGVREPRLEDRLQGGDLLAADHGPPDLLSQEAIQVLLE